MLLPAPKSQQIGRPVESLNPRVKFADMFGEQIHCLLLFRDIDGTQDGYFLGGIAICPGGCFLEKFAQNFCLVSNCKSFAHYF